MLSEKGSVISEPAGIVSVHRDPHFLAAREMNEQPMTALAASYCEADWMASEAVRETPVNFQRASSSGWRTSSQSADRPP
jgi:hypothetical protein